MQYIHSKDIFLLIRDTLKLYDRRLMIHGSRAAYYVYKMLQYKGGYKDYRLADIVFLVAFHDIGAYRTERMDEILKFETNNYHAHSLYGYLFLKGLSHIGEETKTILYHHWDEAQLVKINFEHKELAASIHIAEAIDIYRESLGEKFHMAIFQKHLGSKYSSEQYRLFMDAEQEYGLFGKINSGEYKKELDELTDNFILQNHEKEKLMRFLMFTLALKSEQAVEDGAAILALCEKLGMEMGLVREELELLRYACYVHDIGMIGLPREWLENQGKITQRDSEKIKQHTLLMERLLQDRLKKEIIEIAAAHHEHANGSGYPRGIREKQMSLSQLILQFADAVHILIHPGPERGELGKEKIIELVKTQTEAGIFSQAVARTFLERYDDIVKYVEKKSKLILIEYHKIKIQYDSVMMKKE